MSEGTSAWMTSFVDVELEPQPLAEAQLLDAEVEVERVDLLAQRDLFHRVLVERVAQEVRQPRRPHWFAILPWPSRISVEIAFSVLKRKCGFSW